MFDGRMLGQAFGNVIKNAVEAIEAVPSDRARRAQGHRAHPRCDAARSRFVVDVIDNGSEACRRRTATGFSSPI